MPCHGQSLSTTQRKDNMITRYDVERHMEREHLKEWSKVFPTEPGLYWFWGYRYGKKAGDDPELTLLLVTPCANGMLSIADAQFMWESEVEEAFFMPVDVPDLPLQEG